MQKNSPRQRPRTPFTPLPKKKKKKERWKALGISPDNKKLEDIINTPWQSKTLKAVKRTKKPRQTYAEQFAPTELFSFQ